MPLTDYKICSRGIWDSSVPGIKFDENGASNYSRIHDTLVKMYPRGEKGIHDWNIIVEKMKVSGKGKKYDCLIGVSGGVDSSYLLHICKKQYGLRPLAVNLDNGWSSEIAVGNIQKVTNSLSIDLETYVIDYEEIKDLLRSYIYAGLPWVDIPTDMAIKASLFKVAAREKIKYILRGNDFRSEGKQPREWTYSDAKQLKYIHKHFGEITKLKSYPLLSLSKMVYYGYLKGIKEIRPFYFLDYNKTLGKEILIKEYNWKDYGGHHFENLFTKFAISYWLPKKFGIDKRRISLSAQVLSGTITRDKALEMIKEELDEIEQNNALNYVLKKLDISESEFNRVWNSKNKSFSDYPSYYNIISRFARIIIPIVSLVYPLKPMTFIEISERSKTNK